MSEDVWARRDEVISLVSADGGLLLLGEEASQPVHLADAGRDLWECLGSPVTLHELAEQLAPEESPEHLVPEIRGVLESLAGFGLCHVMP